MGHSIIQNSKIVPSVVPTIGSVGNMTPVEVDARGFDRACFILETGAGGAGAATLDCKIQDAATAGGALVDYANAALTQITKAAGANKTYVIDLPINSARPFLKPLVTATTDTFANSVTCVLYRGSAQYPVAAPATQAIVL